MNDVRAVGWLLSERDTLASVNEMPLKNRGSVSGKDMTNSVGVDEEGSRKVVHRECPNGATIRREGGSLERGLFVPPLVLAALGNHDSSMRRVEPF